MNGLANYRRAPLRRQGGTAAVEMALLSFVMAAILFSPIMIARFLMQVGVAQRAAYNAVHMIATYPPYQRMDAAADPVAEARAMAAETLADGGVAMFAVGAANCTNSTNCTSKFAPTDISINIDANVIDPRSILPTFLSMTINASASDRYAN